MRPRQREQLQRVVQRDRVQRHGLRAARTCAAWPVVAVGQHLGHVRPEPAALGDDLVAGRRVGAERDVAAGLVEQLGGALGGQLVGRGALGHVHPLAVPLQVGPVPADPDHDVGAGQRERAHVPGVDVAEVADQLLQALLGCGPSVPK